MTREEKVHWIENVLFENGGEISNLQLPTTYGDNKCDFIKRVSMFNAEGLMVHLQMKNISIPIVLLTDESVDALFRAVCIK